MSVHKASKSGETEAVHHSWKTGGIVELKVIRKPSSCFRHRAIGFEIDVLILHAFPKPFDKNVVHPAAFPTHADRNIIRIKGIGKDFRSKLTALIRVKDYRTAIVLAMASSRASTQNELSSVLESLQARSMRLDQSMTATR
jgi:hypothetical protein